MQGIALEDLSVVGFEGSFEVECGRGLAVALHRPTGRYLKLDDSSSSPPLFHDRREIDALAARRLVTLFPQPFEPVPNGMVVFATETLRRAGNLPFSRHVRGVAVSWQEVRADGERAAVAYLPEPLVNELLDEWGSRFSGLALEALVEFFRSGRKAALTQAETMADLGICAALDPDLRPVLFARMGVAMLLSDAHEGLANWHACIIQPEFPNWTWELFMDEVKRIAVSIRARVELDEPARDAQPHRPPRRRRADAVADLGDRLLRQGTAVKLDEVDLQLLQEEPGHRWYMNAVDDTDDGKEIHPRNFMRAYAKVVSMNVGAGHLTRYIQEHHRKARSG